MVRFLLYYFAALHEKLRIPSNPQSKGELCCDILISVPQGKWKGGPTMLFQGHHKSHSLSLFTHLKRDMPFYLNMFNISDLEDP